jgi:4-hydroxybenzoate polyprenyltransferase
VRTKILATTVAALALGLGTPGYATSSSPSSSSGNNSNVQLSTPSGFSISFLVSSWGGNYQQYIDTAIDTLRSRGMGMSFFGNGHYKKPPRDAGKVPEPGAVGVFSIGLLVAGALIRRLGRKA